MTWWERRVLPWIVEKSCRSSAIREERARWIPQASGRVLELGVGTGLNLAFYDATRVEHVVGIDPVAAMLEKAAARAADTRIRVELVRAPAEQLPFDDHSFDSAVTTYSLCSVADPVRALAELRRVLVPGGPLIFVEHGRAPDPGPRRTQRWLTPLWSRVGGGCRLDRDIGQLLDTSGFTAPALERGYTEGPRWLSYAYQGIACSRRPSPI